MLPRSLGKSRRRDDDQQELQGESSGLRLLIKLALLAAPGGPQAVRSREETVQRDLADAPQQTGP
ncbi:hypothetical protein I41_37410 [Lacipirellula limnantheis]|uniref:Uncharacterized protein n=1 Tax=Lacipirellula limnantheis TaxID=2528024 RepID=A0A517U1P0_9BACT|nr:hypothetical protein I41_37410 [Lacipirellula limnantheis]